MQRSYSYAVLNINVFSQGFFIAICFILMMDNTLLVVILQLLNYLVA